jgi:hypothetical protein
MHAGVPIVATAVGGIPDQIADGETGLLVPPGDPTALAAAVTRLLTVPGLRERLSASARDAASRRFSHDGMVHRIEEVYARMLGTSAETLAVARPVATAPARGRRARAEDRQPHFTMAEDAMPPRHENLDGRVRGPDEERTSDPEGLLRQPEGPEPSDDAGDLLERIV